MLRPPEVCAAHSGIKLLNPRMPTASLNTGFQYGQGAVAGMSDRVPCPGLVAYLVSIVALGEPALPETNSRCDSFHSTRIRLHYRLFVPPGRLC